MNLWNLTDQLTETDMKILSEDMYRSVMETSRPYPDEEIMYFLEHHHDWSFEKIAEHTGYTIEYVKEVNELYEYLQAEQAKQKELEEEIDKANPDIPNPYLEEELYFEELEKIQEELEKLRQEE